MDRLVAGLRDDRLAESLEMDPELTLLKATEKAKRSEKVKAESKVVRGNRTEELTVDRVFRQQSSKGHRYSLPRRMSGTSGESTSTRASGGQNTSKSCPRCGRNPSHPAKECPAKKAVCRRCSRTGHYEVKCRSKNVNEVDEEDCCHSTCDESEDEYLGVIIAACSQETDNAWYVDILCNNVKIPFKVDTGADVTIIPKEYVKRMGRPVIKES
jgi:hypothetical protein